jgi:hypothetical protein
MKCTHALAVWQDTPEAEDMLDMLCRVVRAHRARLTILVVRLVPLTEPLPVYEPGADAEVEAMIARADRFADRLGVKAAHTVRYAREVSSAAAAEMRVHGVDLVGIAMPPGDAGGRHGLGTLRPRPGIGLLVYRPATNG